MTENQEDWITQQETAPEKPERPSFALGIHENVSNEDYHRSEPVGSTGLKRILQSPAHFRWPKKFDSTRAKEIGSAIHCAILEPDRFLTDYKIVDCEDRRKTLYTTACKTMPSDRVFITKEYENIKGAHKGVMRNPECRELIELPGRYELSLFTKCPVTGVLVKVRYDKLTDSGIPVDLKKTQDARRDAFSRAIYAYGYHISAALYMDAWEWQFGEKLDVMRWIAVEEQSPHAAMRYMPDEDALMIGRAKYTEALQIYANCLDRDEWPAYDEPEEIGLPYYVLRQEDEVEIDFGGEE
jgi:exodeoxyribonuclease VIII